MSTTLVVALAELIETASLGRAGRDLFVHFMPHTIKKGILLIDGVSGSKRDPYIPGYRRGKFQAIVRTTTRLEGENLAFQLADLLTLDNTRLTGVHVKRIAPIHDPLVYPYSDGSALEFSTNFEAVYALTD